VLKCGCDWAGDAWEVYNEANTHCEGSVKTVAAEGVKVVESIQTEWSCCLFKDVASLNGTISEPLTYCGIVANENEVQKKQCYCEWAGRALVVYNQANTHCQGSVKTKAAEGMRIAKATKAEWSCCNFKEATGTIPRLLTTRSNCTEGAKANGANETGAEVKKCTCDWVRDALEVYSETNYFCEGSFKTSAAEEVRKIESIKTLWSCCSFKDEASLNRTVSGLLPTFNNCTEGAKANGASETDPEVMKCGCDWAGDAREVYYEANTHCEGSVKTEAAEGVKVVESFQIQYGCIV